MPLVKSGIVFEDHRPDITASKGTMTAPAPCPGGMTEE